MLHSAALRAKHGTSKSGTRWYATVSPTQECCAVYFFFLPPSTCSRPAPLALHNVSGMSTSHSPADDELIDGLTNRVIKQFRDHMYSGSYISENPHLFLDNAWIDVVALRRFLEKRGHGDSAHDMIVVSSSSPGPSEPLNYVKREFNASNTLLVGLGVKTEPPPASVPPRTRTVRENDRDVIVLSDSDSEPEPPVPVVDESMSVPTSPGSYFSDSSDADADPSTLHESDTVWMDPYISSMARDVSHKLSSDRRSNVERIEILTEIPTFWPVPLKPTAYIVDISHSKWNKLLEEFTVDALIKNKDNDSWTGNSGMGDSKPMVCFGPGEDPIECRRSRMNCSGARACAEIDPTLINVVRRELDPSSRDVIFEAQLDTRRMEGNTAEGAVAVFMNVIRQPCGAVDTYGHKCKGKPILKPKPQGTSHGHKYFVACSGWTKTFKESHRTFTIPKHLNEALVVKAISGESMAEGKSKDTKPCSRIVHPHIGGKLKFCPHAHVIGGKANGRSPIQHHVCGSKRTYFVPLDRKIRKAIVFHPGCIPHTHPMPPPLKPSHEGTTKYRASVDTVGCVGATVAKVDHAPSTKILFDGQTPAEYSPALHGKRVKRDIVAQQKKKAYPAGLGIPGAYQLYLNDLDKPIQERYVHRFINTQDGGLIIFTCFTDLLSLLDDAGVEAFEDDTTFKRVKGDLNEWEVAIFYKAIQRAITLARAYINRSNTDFFELLFDTFRQLKIEATGKDLQFSRFMEGGNLLVMNADMEAAQALGAARSILRTNQPQFSGITTVDPAIFATYFIKICSGHSIRPVNEFKSLVSADDFRRLKDFMSIDSVESLHSFTQFVKDLGVKKIQDWWSHKEMSDWIVPCLVKSQSQILPEHWDRTPATTNTGEAQHHWTNSLTGIQLTLVEAIEGAHVADGGVVSEVRASIKTGVLPNPNNEMSHRMSRNMGRQSTAARKAREFEELGNVTAELKAKISEEKALRKQSTATQKALQDQLKATTGAATTGRSKQKKNNYESVVIAASSSGRVRTVMVPVKETECLTAAAEPLAGPTVPPPSFPLVPEVSLSDSSPLPTSASDPQGFNFDAAQFVDTQFDATQFDYNAFVPYFAPNPVQTSFDFGFDLGNFDAGAMPTFDAATYDLEQLLTAPDPVANHLAVEYGFDWNAFSPPDGLPTLPAPPMSSPLAELPTEPLIDVGPSDKSKGKRQEVDERNILHTRRVRIPRTRATDDTLFDRPTKKPRTT
ncbi:hypothetical protein B0H11DRAFT_2293918 [Mycena galericulata]|nr:hypothetical protein B0H11DRAFT_2293918 [Mycena galericulata]